MGAQASGNGPAADGVRLVFDGEVVESVVVQWMETAMYREDGVAEETYAQAVLGRIEKSARAAMGDEGYEAAVRDGEALSRDEAVELALSITTD